MNIFIIKIGFLNFRAFLFILFVKKAGLRFFPVSNWRNLNTGFGDVIGLGIQREFIDVGIVRQSFQLIKPCQYIFPPAN